MNATQDDTGARDDAAQPGRLATNIAVLIVAVILLLPAAGFWWLKESSRAAVERSRLSHARDMLIRHHARTRGQWPRSWDDLAADFRPADANYGTPSLDALKQTVVIDFDFDVEAIDKANPDKPPRLLWLKGQPDTPAVADTNARLLDAIHARRAAREGH